MGVEGDRAGGRRAFDRSAVVERWVQVLIMLAIGGAAGAGSFRHVHDVAAAHGQAGIGGVSSTLP
jgi:hypothetical protein